MTAVGDARKRQAVENTRRVRVTVEGDAVGWPGSSVLRVYVGASQVVTVDPSWHGVSVEDVRPERVWTDRDVVAGQFRVYTRHNGEWLSQDDNTPRPDGVINELLANQAWTVLRYQAGE